MNKERRKVIESLLRQCDLVKCTMEISKDQEDYAYECLPENLQNTEKGEKMQSNIDDLESALSSIEEVVSSLQDIIER